MDFLNRDNEQKRLNNLLKLKEGALAVIWGRRRVGKTRLLLEWCNKHNGIYYVASQTNPLIQIQDLANVISQKIPNFNNASYNSWDQLFLNLSNHISNSKWKGPLVIDEFPYLIQESKELPSILQKYIDHPFKQAGLKLAIAGSSQHMMQGLALNYNSPLYGRATELFKLSPLDPKYILPALQLSNPTDAIQAYSIFGGIPRYWELARPYKNNLKNAILELILDPLGPLHQEPRRLLLEEGSSLNSLKPTLDIIGSGIHRISEIAARLQTPSSKIQYSLNKLQELNIIQRETPYSSNPKNTKLSLYKIHDPFFRFWFSCVNPYLSLLLQSPPTQRFNLIQNQLQLITSQTWESICLSFPPKHQPKKSSPLWLPPSRFWKGNGPEWDLISTCSNNKNILLGEAKWPSKPITENYINSTLSQLTAKGLPPIKNASSLTPHYYLFLPSIPKNIKITQPNTHLIDAATLLNT